MTTVNALKLIYISLQGGLCSVIYEIELASSIATVVSLPAPPQEGGLYVIWLFDSKRSVSVCPELHRAYVYFRFLFHSQALGWEYEIFSCIESKTPPSNKAGMVGMNWWEVIIIHVQRWSN